MTSRLGSLCTGFGGLDLAVASLLDVDTVWHAETDPAASKVLAAHWPDIPNLGDITATDWSAAERVDVLCAGFPCQGFSAAGKRKGSADERHLWPTGVLPAISAQRPPLAVLENVPGLLTIEAGSVFGQVLADLDDLGYAVAWSTVGACRVGACHHRHRVFIAATLAEVAPPAGQPVGHRAGAGWATIQAVLFGDAQAVKWPQAGMTAGGLLWEIPADVCGADGVVLPTPTAHCEPGKRGLPNAGTAAARMDAGRRNLDDAVALMPTPRVAAGRTGRSAILGSSSAPSLEQALEIARGELPRELSSWDEAPASWQPLPTPTARDATCGAGRTFAEGRPLSEVIALLPTPTTSAVRGAGVHGDGGLDLRTTVSLLPTPRASDAAKGGPNQRGSSGDLMLPAAVQPQRFGVYEAAVQRQEQAFGLSAPDPTEPGRLGKPRLSAAFPEWMVGLPRGWITDHVGRNDSIRIAGNGVVPAAAAYGLSTLPTFRAALRAALSRAAVRAA